MFGMNQRVGKSHFKEFKDDELLVTSKFYTLQGEGPYRGMPAYFIRLTYCNLQCHFCDTYFDSGDKLNFNSILKQAQLDIWDFYSKRNMKVPDWVLKTPSKVVLVITGGEPSLQKNLGNFLSWSNRVFYKSQIESNGIILANVPDETTYVVSPKCAEKNGVSIKYFKPNPKVLERADCLKFVMSAPESKKYSPYSEVPDWAHEWTKKTGKAIFVSPMNIYKKEPQKAKELRSNKKDITIEERSTVDEVISFWEPDLLDMKANQRNHEYTAEYAMKYGFILNLQTHLYASLP